MSELPEGWIECKLETIAADVTYGYTAKSTDQQIGPHMLRITDIQNNKVNWSEVPYCAISKSDKEKYLLKSGDLVFARTGATVGKSFLITGNVPEAVYASYLIRVRCLISDTEAYLSHFFRSPLYWEQITELSAGVGQPNVNGSKLKELNIPLAPLAEQKRIADKLDTLLSRVDAARERLDRIPTIIKQFRQAVLAAATSGRLTEGWREENSGGEWSFPYLEELVIESVNGLSKRTGRNGDEITILRLADFKDAVRVYGNERQIKLDDKEQAKYGLVDGDILVIRVNGSVDLAGRFIRYHAREKLEGFCDHFIRLRLDTDRLLATYLTYVANEGEGRQYLKGSLSTSAGQNTINQGSVKGLKIPLPSIDEQNEIVRRVEALFALADQLEARYQQARAQLDALMPSLLAKAFRGELVEQDPNDEPAEKLLERVRAAREEEAKPARRKAAAAPRQKAVDDAVPKRRGRPRKA